MSFFKAGRNPVSSPTDQVPTGTGRWARVHRDPWFSVLITGICAFTAPGIWASMNSLGAGGTASVQLVNTVNALLYAFMTVTCILGPFLTRLIGFRYTLSLGTIGYPVYAAGLYMITYNGTTWLAYLGSTLCGISAGLFWSVEGAITTGYPMPEQKGRSIALWLTFRNLGVFVGGCISLALNIHAKVKGHVGYGTYKAFIAIQCLGAPVALLLAEPGQVVRADGTTPGALQADTWKKEAKAIWKLFLSRPILLLSPLFWCFGWQQSYHGTYFATYFTVRSRALGSFLYSVLGSASIWLTGIGLDTKWTSRQKRAKTVFTFLAAANTTTWIWYIITQHRYLNTHPTLDWANPGFAAGFGVYLWSIVSHASIENFIYWAIGNLSEEAGDQIRYSALLRGIETAGVAVGFGVQAIPANLLATAAINFVFWMIALPFGALATLRVVDVFNKARGDIETAGNQSGDGIPDITGEKVEGGNGGDGNGSGSVATLSK